MELDERKKKILACVVENYIANGEPVGSKLVSSFLDNAVSSATIRNDMAALEKQGLLVQPHTSAGRVPTQAGYRFYVDHLMSKAKIKEKDKHYIDAFLKSMDSDPNKLVEHISHALAEFTRYVSLYTTPAPARAVIKDIQLLRTGKRAVYLLLITNSGAVKTKACRVDYEISDEELVVFANMAKQSFCNIPVDELTPAGVQTLAASLGQYSLSLSPLVFAVYQLAKEVTQSNVFFQGQSNLLAYEEIEKRARDLLSLFADRKQMLALLSRDFSDLKVFIGDETCCDEMKDTSMVVAKYKLGNVPLGTIGVIGPSRMDYGKIIPNIEYFAGALGNMLYELLNEQ